MNITRFKEYILNLFFPRECTGCNKLGTWLCHECLQKLPIRDTSQKTSIRHQDYIDRVYIASYYSEASLQKTIDLYKYHYQEKLAEPLAEIFFKFINNNKLKTALADFSLLALPLHRRRFLERGFNQSQLLADKLSSKYNLPLLDDVLTRNKYTKHQTLLNHNERQANIKGVFVVKQPAALLGKKILLIDDVVTTGASLNEAARILRQAGAVKVWGLVLAKN